MPVDPGSGPSSVAAVIRLARVLCLAALFLFRTDSWAEVYQFVDEEGTLVVTNRPGDLPTDRPVRVLVGRRNRPTGEPPAPANPATVTVVGRPEPEFLVDRGTEGVRFRYYEVCAATAAGALSQAVESGPYDPREGRRYPAQTRWSLGWSYDYSVPERAPGPDGARDVLAEVYDVEVYADVEVVLPRLAPDCRMPEAERRRFERAMDGLRRHEMDHVNLVLNEEALQAMADSIAGLRRYRLPQGGTAGLRRRIQDDTHADAVVWVRWIRDLNRRYDEVTEHGLKPEERTRFFRSLSAGGRRD